MAYYFLKSFYRYQKLRAKKDKEKKSYKISNTKIVSLRILIKKNKF